MTVQAPTLADLTIDLAVSAGSFNVLPAQVAEGNSRYTTVPVTITLDRAAAGPVTVAWATADGTAVAGPDYRAASGTVTLKARKMRATIMLKVRGDTLVEPDETFSVVLSSPTSATLATSSATVTIKNDD